MLQGCGVKSSKIAPSLTEPIYVVEAPEINSDGTMECTAAYLWIMEELDHIKAANERLKEIRNQQEREPYNPLTWW